MTARPQRNDRYLKLKFDLQNDGDLHTINRFGPDHFLIGDRRFTSSVIVTSDYVDHWQIDDLSALSSTDFEKTLTHQPEVVILGTGDKTRFPDSALLKPLINAQIGLEVMDTAAACRTYNVLVGDYRRVVALLWLSPVKSAS